MAGYLAGDVDEWIYIDIEDQHEDSIRFIKDCEKAIGKEIKILKSKEYRCVEDCIKVFGGFKDARNNFAPCTNWLKKRVRKRHLNDTFGQHVHVKEADILDWTDENPLNYENCDLAECEKYFHDKYPVREDRSVEVGKTYRHFKGKIVEVIAISQDTESPGQYYVVYKCEDGAIWSRPYGMFVGKVDRKKYPDADQEYRFEEVQNGHQK